MQMFENGRCYTRDISINFFGKGRFIQVINAKYYKSTTYTIDFNAEVCEGPQNEKVP